MEEFKQVRETLIDMLEDLDDRLEKITNDNVKHSDEAIDKDLDISIEGIGNSLEGNKADETEKIKQAISQIDAGSYGICLQCGQAIKKERLKIFPLSQRCIHCVKQ